jgi:hypothetical protein
MARSFEDARAGPRNFSRFSAGTLESGIAEIGQYELRDKAGKVLDHGKYIVVWRKEGGKWKLPRDMFSTNVPAVKK